MEWILACALVVACLALQPIGVHAAEDRPNVVVILVDDMGFSDVGAYGGEIDTPNIDRLAANGVKFTQFYNTARCCPTRASLMTGLHPAQTGIGHMTQTPKGPETHDRHVPGYRGILREQTATLAEVLKSAGYTTLMAGKWHLGYHDPRAWPMQRGFDRFFGIIPGACNYFHPAGERGLTYGNDPVEPTSTTDGPFYTTDAFTDWAIRFVDEADRDTPFFLYLAYNAPHWPLQAPDEDIAKYRGKYKQGWDKLRQARYQRQQSLGLIDGDTVPLSDRDAPAWDSLTPEQQDELDLRMSIYAAMVDHMDQNVGKLVKALDDMGELDNTVILFLSDNGGCAEGDMLGSGEVLDADQRNDGYFITYGQAWANLSNTPFRKYKHFSHEGGISTPLIVQWPAGIERTGVWQRQPAYLPDIMPTLIELAGAEYPQTRGDEPLPALEGVSLVPAFHDQPLNRESPMFWEHEGNRAVRDGHWKLVSTGPLKDYGGEDSWALYDMTSDRSETRNVEDEHPDVVQRLSGLWWEWARTHEVVPNRPDGPTKP